MTNNFFIFFLLNKLIFFFFFFSSRRRHTRSLRDWSSDVCSSDLHARGLQPGSGVMENRDPAGASRSDDQIFLAVAVEIDPGDTWTELAEGVGQQRLAPKVVKVRLDVRVAAELRSD